MNWGRLALVATVVGVLVCGVPFVWADIGEEDTRPPLPLHSFEGVGGVFVTHSAYLVNPAREGDVLGLPAVSAAYMYLGHSRHLTAVTLTETIGDRLELGYGWNRLDTGDFQRDVMGATGVRVQSYLNLHTFSMRFAAVKDGDFEQTWMPQITLGVHFKYNQDIRDMNKDLGGVLRGADIRNDKGMEGTVYASKMIPGLPRPVMVNAGLRYSDAALAGLAGFTREYTVRPEANVVVLLTDKAGISGEYRFMPDKFDRIGNVVREERDWWTICGFYVFNSHLTMTAVYGNLGPILNHPVREGVAIRFKYEL